MHIVYLGDEPWPELGSSSSVVWSLLEFESMRSMEASVQKSAAMSEGHVEHRNWGTLFPALSKAALLALSQAEAAKPRTRPLYNPLVSAPTVASTSLLPTSEASAITLLAVGGDAEAQYDLCGLFTVLFGTGSSGIMKGVPVSRAYWAVVNGSLGHGQVTPGVARDVVVLHNSLAHG